MRVAFLGNARWSVPSMEALAGSAHHVALVATRTPRPARRGGRPVATPVSQSAARLGLPLREIETVKAGPGLDALEQTHPDVLVVVAYGEILPPAVLGLPTEAPVNVHFSLLPELRGAAPVHRAIMAGLTATGVTTIRMDQGMDTGPILLQAEEAIEPHDDSGSLGDRLAAIGGRLLVDTLDRMEAGDLVERRQDDARATYAPKLTADDRLIRWEEPADRVMGRVRALSPEPGATTSFRGRVLKVFRADVSHPATPTAQQNRSRPGAVEADAEGGLVVWAGDRPVRLLEVAPEGSRRMSGAEFFRGHRPKVGEILG